MTIKPKTHKVRGKHHKFVMPVLFILFTLVILGAVARTVMASSAGVVFWGRIATVVAICTPDPNTNPCNPFLLAPPYVVVATVDGLPNLVGIIPMASLGLSKTAVPGNWIVGFGAQTGPAFVATTYWMYSLR